MHANISLKISYFFKQVTNNISLHRSLIDSARRCVQSERQYDHLMNKSNKQATKHGN